MELLERRQQLETLQQCLHEARGACGKVVLMAGEAGIGKSALIERFVAEHRRDAHTLWGACDPFDTPRALGALHKMAAQSHGTTVAESARDQLFRILFSELARPERSCIAVLEDLHWADEATLDFLRFVSRRIQRTHALVVVTYREEELALTHPVRLAIGDLTGQHIIRMRLQPLGIGAVRDLAKATSWDADTLHRITGGNPFFLREALAAHGDQVPATVRDAVLSRLMRASPAVRELAQLLSVSPGRTSLALIESIVGPQPDALQEGVHRGLFQVHNDALAFRHELARLAVYSSLPPARARAAPAFAAGARETGHRSERHRAAGDRRRAGRAGASIRTRGRPRGRACRRASRSGRAPRGRLALPLAPAWPRASGTPGAACGRVQHDELH